MKKVLIPFVAVLILVMVAIYIETCIHRIQSRSELGEAYTMRIIDEHTILFTSEEDGDTFKMSVEDSSCLEENSRIFIKR